jgi:hypothetical protein
MSSGMGRAADERPPRRDSRPTLVLVALAALALMLGGTAWALLQVPPPLQVARLPDGTELRLEAVTMGREHRYVGGPRWRRLLARVLPSGWLDRTGWKVHSYRTLQAGTLVFWTTRPMPLNALAGPQDWPSIVFDEHGCQTKSFTVLNWQDLVSSRMTEAFGALAYPRRGQTVGLRVGSPVGVGTAPTPAEFRVTNPAPGPYPVWRPEPMPIARRDGEMTFTLTGLTTGLEGPGPTLQRAAPGKPIWSRASFHITESDRPSDGWTVAGLTLSDATGNEVQPDAFSQYRHEGRAHFALKGGLCAEEPAWKLRAEFAQTRGFEPGDLWVVRGVPIAKRGRLVDTRVSFTRHGVTARLLGIAGSAAQAPNGMAMGGFPAAYVQAPARLKGLHLTLVQARDDRGRTIQSTRTGTADVGWYSFSLPAHTDARSVDLTFALHRSRFAEFVARPSRLPAKPGRR